MLLVAGFIWQKKKINTDIGFYNWAVEYLAKRRNITKKQMFQELIGLEKGKKETLFFESFISFQFIYMMYGSEWGKKAVEVYMSSFVEDVIDSRKLVELIRVFCPLDNRQADLQTYFGGLDSHTEKYEEFEHMLEQKRKSMVRKLPVDKMLEYLLHQSCKEGYAFTINEFLKDWAGYLILQKDCYGKIKEKYPKNLKSSLKRLTYEYKLHEEEISKKKWENALNNMRKLEYSDGTYLIKSPRCKEDMENESEYLHNCVRNYANKVFRGEEQILFMRKCTEEDIPLVTLEVFPDGRVGQMFRAYNAKPSEEEMEFIKKWAKTKHLIMPDNPLPPRVADEDFNNFDYPWG